MIQILKPASVVMFSNQNRAISTTAIKMKQDKLSQKKLQFI